LLYILYALFFISCVVLIGSVLLQPGKTDAGALFTSNVSSTAFSPRGTASVLSKFTIGAAALFMISALMISMPALSGNVSVMQGSAEDTAVEVPSPTPAAEAPVATTEANVQPGETQKIIIPADSNNTTTVVNSPAAKPTAVPGSKTMAVPIQPNPPANK
jgi:preprotein translocase subunit SecG